MFVVCVGGEDDGNQKIDEHCVMCLFSPIGVLFGQPAGDLSGKFFGCVAHQKALGTWKPMI
jgi:hypothetical protein